MRQRKVVSYKLFLFNRRLNKESCFRCMKIQRFGGKEKIQKNPPLCLSASVLILSQRLRDTETQSFLHPPLPLCVKILLSQSRDSFPNLVNPVNPVKKVCLCVKRRFYGKEGQTLPYKLCTRSVKTAIAVLTDRVL